MAPDVRAERDRYAKEVGVMLAKMRRTAGLTQHQLGAAIGGSQSYVAKLEAGRRGADLAEVMVWARACGIEFHTSLRFANGSIDGRDTTTRETIAGLVTAASTGVLDDLARLVGAAIEMPPERLRALVTVAEGLS